MTENISFLQMNNTLAAADVGPLPECRFLILRNITVETIDIYYRYFCYEMGLNAKLSFGGYNTVLQDVIDGAWSAYQDIQYISIFLYLDNISPNLARNFNSLSPEQVAGEVGYVENYIDSVVEAIRGRSDAVILWHGFERPVFAAAGIFDSQTDEGQTATIEGLNRHLRTALNNCGNAYFIDVNLCLARLGFERFYDQRFWHMNQSPYSSEGWRGIVSEDFKIIRYLKGKMKKCIVLDCDNVLWGGILGEDGLDGIKLDTTNPGSKYYEFQQEVLTLFHRGVLIALCSKNNESDVWEVFEKHPNMLLKKEHIAAYRINWDNKADNIAELAQEMNLGLEHFVFVDDSEFEIRSVNEFLPEVATIHIPEQKAADSRRILQMCGFFENLSVTDEDKKRTNMYQAERERKRSRNLHHNIDDFLKTLGMELVVQSADDMNISRIAQLTQRTNQFNLTARRYTETDIRGFADDDDCMVFCASVRDKFGDFGIVAVLIAKREGDSCVFDTFLMSCRVIGRNIESVFLDACCEKIIDAWGVNRWIAEYIPTKKNKQADKFWDNRNYTVTGESGGGHKKYELKESDRVECKYDYIRVG